MLRKHINSSLRLPFLQNKAAKKKKTGIGGQRTDVIWIKECSKAMNVMCSWNLAINWKKLVSRLPIRLEFGILSSVIWTLNQPSFRNPAVENFSDLRYLSFLLLKSFIPLLYFIAIALTWAVVG